MKSEDQRGDFGDAMRDLRSELKANSQFKNLAADRREKILSGQEVYVFGLRDAVRLMGWNVDEFNFIYAYLSSHSHSGPVSFMRLDEHGVDFLNPTSAQYSTAALAIEFAIKALQVGSARIASLFSSAG